MQKKKEKDLNAGIKGFSARLGQIIGDQSLLSFSKKCGISDSLLRKYLRGSLPGLDNLLKIADTAGVSVEWLATGEGPKVKEEKFTQINKRKGEYFFLRTLDWDNSANSPFLVEDKTIKPQYAFRKARLDKMCKSPVRAFLMKVKGNSMHPTISDGDIVLIDSLGKNIISGKIFLILIDFAVIIKRLEPLPCGKVRIISDNPKYTEYETDVSDIDILGQVVWVAKELEKPEV